MFKNKDGKIRSGWKIVVVTFTILALLLGFSIVANIIVTKIFISGGNIYLENNVYTERAEQFLINLNLVISYIQEFIMIFIPIIAWKTFMKRPLSDMGLCSIRNHAKELLVGLIFGAISMSLVFLLLIFTKSAEVEVWTPYFSSDTITYLILFILVGFAEEIYGRGFIMSTLKQTKSIPVVVIVSAVIFALLHSNNSGIGFVPYINLTLIAVLFAYIYIKSGNIWMCIGYHITWNYFQGNVFGFLVSGMNTRGIITTIYKENTILNGGEFGPEGGLIVTAIILIGFLFVKLFYKNNQNDFIVDEVTAEDTYEELKS